MNFSADGSDLIFIREDRNIYIKSLATTKNLITLPEVHDAMVKAFVVMKKNVIVSADSLGSIFFTGVKTHQSVKVFGYLHPSTKTPLKYMRLKSLF